MTRPRRSSLLPLRASAAARAPRPEASLREARRHRRWATLGAVCGAVVGIVAFLPATLVANAVSGATGDRVVLAEVEGTVWNGSGLAVLTGGPGSRDASVLPSRLEWQLRPRWNGAAVHLSQDCCMQAGLDLRVHAGWGTTRVEVADAPGDGVFAQWPAGWLEGLGSLWKTVHPGGLLRLGTRHFAVVRDGADWHVDGEARLEIRQASARLTTLDTLGSYQLVLAGSGAGAATPAAPGAPRPAASPGEPAHLTLSTLDGALILDGTGEIGARGARFRGQARAAPGSEDALNNLLNIIGRRSGATSLISIG
jgi:general secretion pathway protein N